MCCIIKNNKLAQNRTKETESVELRTIKWWNGNVGNLQRTAAKGRTCPRLSPQSTTAWTNTLYFYVWPMLNRGSMLCKPRRQGTLSFVAFSCLGRDFQLLHPLLLFLCPNARFSRKDVFYFVVIKKRGLPAPLLPQFPILCLTRLKVQSASQRETHPMKVWSSLQLSLTQLVLDNAIYKEPLHVSSSPTWSVQKNLDISGLLKIFLKFLGNYLRRARRK